MAVRLIGVGLFFIAFGTGALVFRRQMQAPLAVLGARRASPLLYFFSFIVPPLVIGGAGIWMLISGFIVLANSR